MMKALISPLILLFLTNLSFADLLKSCRNNVCQNGGTCMLMSPTPPYTKCNSKEVYHNHNCYEIIREALNRSSAAEYCNRRLHGEQAGGLLSIRDEKDRRFIGDALQNNVADKSKAYLSIGFWTGGRSIGKLASNLSWYWQNTTQPMTEHFWNFNEPKTDDDLNNLCISLNADSLFQSWNSRSCSDLNFFVCERTASDLGEHNWLTQCKCGPNSTGKYCEIQSDLSNAQPGGPEVEGEVESLTCEDESFLFSCPNGGVILVDYALYGYSNLSNSSRCSTKNSVIESDACIDSSSLQMLVQKCQGLTYCTFPSVQELFGQRPCPREIPVGLSTRLRCSDDSNIPNKCPTGALYIQGRCYKPSLEKVLSWRKTYDEAQAECGVNGGNLANPQREPIFSMLYSEISKAAEKLNMSATDEKFWVRNESLSLPSTSVWQNMCPYLNLKLDKNVPEPGSCQSRLHWICEYPPTSDLTQRITESLTTSTAPSTTSTTVSTTTPSTTTISSTLPPARTAQDQQRVPGLYCPEITWMGIKFPETPACQDAVVDCPNSDEISGHIRFSCGCEHGTWMNTADLSNCAHKWVGEVTELINKRENSVNIVNQLFHHLRTNVAEQKLYGGDITGIVSNCQQLVPLAHSQVAQMSETNRRIEFAKNFTNTMGNSGDQLLSDRATQAWNQLKFNDRVQRASGLMTVLEQSMVLMSENMGTGRAGLRFTNWASQIENKNAAPEQQRAPAMAPMGARMMAAAAPPAVFSNEAVEPSTIIEFANYSDAPIMQLPGFDILSASAQQNTPMAAFASSADQPRMKSRILNSPPEADPTTKLGYFMYNSVGTLLSPNSTSIINSRVMGAFINDPQQSVTLPPNSPVNFTFYHLRKQGVENPRCVYWDLADVSWSQKGCSLIESTKDFTKCQCSHLTSFAILMDLNSNFDSLVGANAIALDLITIFGCALSIVCLTIAFLIFTLFRSLYSVRHAIHRNLCLCLLVAELLFVIGIDRTSNTVGCRGVAIALHYFFLAAFCWMLLEGYQLYMMLIQVFEPNRSRFYLYYLVGYALPAVIVAISAGITWQNYGTYSYCWINVRTSTLWAFIIPVIVIIISNIIVLLIALRVVLSVKSRDRSTSQRVLGWLKGSCTLLCILGITWVFGFLAAIPGTHIVFAYIFAILNTLQGVFIFILHVVFNDKVRVVLVRAMRRKVCCGVDAPTSSVGGYSTRTGQTFFSKQKLLHFFKSSGDQGSEHNTESTEEKQHSPKVFARIPKLNEIKLPPPEDDELKISEWRSKSLEEEMTDRPSIIVSPTTLMVAANMRERGSSLPSPTELLKVDSLENRHSAPVKRKKFPLGSTEEQRSLELKGMVEPHETGANIIVEKL